MMTREVACLNCGAETVRAQILPAKDVTAGLFTAVITNDAAASVMAARGGALTVHAFCMTCGAIWLPAREYLVRASLGHYGEALGYVVGRS